MIPKPVILDTDWWTDIDDAIAIRCLLWAKEAGYISLLGINVNTVNETSGRALACYLDGEGHPDQPFALEKSAYDTPGAPNYYDVIIQNHPKGKYASTAECPDAENGKMYIEWLKQVPQGQKCTLISIGFLNTLAGLFTRALQEESVMALVREKVGKIFIMGGNYEQGCEYNLNASPRARQAADVVCRSVPPEIPIIFLGFDEGASVHTGGGIGKALGVDDPLFQILLAHGEGEQGRSSWDPMTVLLALLDDPEKSGYTYIQGTNCVEKETGCNTFTKNSDGHHFYVRKNWDDSRYQKMINTIVETPKEKRKDLLWKTVLG